jgi:hypothetical protein
MHCFRLVTLFNSLQNESKFLVLKTRIALSICTALARFTDKSRFFYIQIELLIKMRKIAASEIRYTAVIGIAREMATMARCWEQRCCSVPKRH